MSLWYKGSVKLRYDARTHVTIATPFDTLLEELLLYVASKEHTIAKLADTPQAHTEVEVIPSLKYFASGRWQATMRK